MVGGRVVDVFLKTTLVQFLPCIHCMMLPEAEFSWYITTGHGSGSGWWCSTCGSQYVFRSNARLFGMQTGNTPDTVKYWFSEPPPQSCMNFIEIMKIGTNMRHGNNPYDKSHLTCQTKIAQAIKTFVEKDDEMSLSMMQNIREWKKVVDMMKPVDDESHRTHAFASLHRPADSRCGALKSRPIDIGQHRSAQCEHCSLEQSVGGRMVPICHMIYDILEYREMC